VNLSEVFIRRPVGTSLLMAGMVLAGLAAYSELPVAALPQVDYPTILVSTWLPGASAETVAATITTPLERQLGQVPALAQMTSISSSGSSQITLQFALERNIDAAEQDVQAAINAAANLLPRTLPAPPTYSKSNPADTPILTLSVSSTSATLSAVGDYADSILAQKISQVAGVGLVTLNGGQKPAVRIQVDTDALAGMGLTLEDVRTAVVTANVNQPKGTLDGARLSYALATDDQLYEAEAYRGLIIAYRGGAPVRLREVADVADGVENEQLAGWADGRRAILLNVQRQPGANIIAVTDRVKALLPQLAATLPPGVQVDILSDRTETVRASVEDVELTLLITIGLVVAVIFAFLRDARATLIPAVAVPLSLIGTLGPMYLLGYSLDNLSLMALTIATGFVVDDAIVMVENISRYIEAGEQPLEAALMGARQIGFTILSLTVSLVAVLIPLLFMGGIIGRLFREFAVTLSLAIAVSAVLSLTLTPMMCAHMLRPHAPAARRGRAHAASERFFEAIIGGYDRGLRWVLAHEGITLVATVGTVLLTVLLAVLVPKGFFPLQDTGLIVATTEAPPDTSFAALVHKQEVAQRILLAEPGVAHVTSFVGADGTNPTANSGRFAITLAPRGERADVVTLLTRLATELRAVEGLSVFLQPVQDLQIEGRVSRTQFQYTLEDADADELRAWAPRIVDRLRGLRELTDVASDQQAQGLEAHLDIDRDTASRLGVLPQAIDDILYDAFGQRQISTIFTQLNQYRVILGVGPELRGDPGAIQSLYVRPTAGEPVALGGFTSLTRQPAPLAVNHQGQLPAVTVSFNLAPGAALGDAVNAIRRAVAELGVPGGLRGAFQGTAQAFQVSLASEPALITAALVTVYIVLGVLYESYIHPITILSTLPSAGIGALLALMLCGADFSVIALIGVILLIGIVKKNAIMMIDFALEAERSRGVSPREAIHEACLLRFRPIMMTTLAALLGGLPLALGQGMGSELRRPLGIAIVGGLVISQVLTLYTTPVVYLALDRLQQRLRRGRAHAAAPSEAGREI
jgi:multidrug efflux pump